MTNQKHNNSEEFDPGHSSTRAVDGGGIGSTDPPEEDNDSELLFRAISELQTVREPGRGKLTLQEAITTAISQGDVFSRWCERSTPVGEIEVWVEERRVMSVLPQSPAELQEFTFKVPSPDTAVLQLTTSADGEKTVLYNLRLRDVPSEGLRHVEAWPNGQSMSLNITSKIYAVVGAGSGNSSTGKLEEFYIRIAINPQTVEAASLTTTDGPSPERAITVTEEERSATDEKPKAMAARAGLSSSTKLVVLAGLLILSSILMGGVRNSFWTLPCETNQQLIGASPDGSSTPALAEGNIASTPASAGFDLAIPGLSESHAKVVAARSDLSASALKLRSPARSSKAAVKSDPVVAARHTAPKPEGDQATVAFEHASLSPWQISVYPKLAALRNVHLKLDGQVAETASMENLRVSFVRLWEASERFKVLSDTEQSPVDGVISLSFESTEPCLGVVLLKVSGRDGKFLWQDFAWEAPPACRALPEAGQNNLFGDASIALVNRLKTTIRLAQESTKRTELLANSD